METLYLALEAFLQVLQASSLTELFLLINLSLDVWMLPESYDTVNYTSHIIE